MSPTFQNSVFVPPPLDYTVSVWFIPWKCIKPCPQLSNCQHLNGMSLELTKMLKCSFWVAFSSYNMLAAFKVCEWFDLWLFGPGFCLSGNIQAVLTSWRRLLGLYVACEKCCKHLSGQKKLLCIFGLRKKKIIQLFLFTDNSPKKTQETQQFREMWTKLFTRHV